MLSLSSNADALAHFNCAYAPTHCGHSWRLLETRPLWEALDIACTLWRKTDIGDQAAGELMKKAEGTGKYSDKGGHFLRYGKAALLRNILWIPTQMSHSPSAPRFSHSDTALHQLSLPIVTFQVHTQYALLSNYPLPYGRCGCSRSSHGQARRLLAVGFAVLVH